MKPQPDNNAASGARNSGSAYPSEEKTKTVTLDSPFVFMIIDTETNIPLFIGALTDTGK